MSEEKTEKTESIPVSGRLRHCDSLDWAIPIMELALVDERDEEQRENIKKALEDIKELKKDLKCEIAKIE